MSGVRCEERARNLNSSLGVRRGPFLLSLSPIPYKRNAAETECPAAFRYLRTAEGLVAGARNAPATPHPVPTYPPLVRRMSLVAEKGVASVVYQ